MNSEDNVIIGKVLEEYVDQSVALNISLNGEHEGDPEGKEVLPGPQMSVQSQLQTLQGVMDLTEARDDFHLPLQSQLRRLLQSVKGKETQCFRQSNIESF